jgi:ribosomal protein S21
MEKKKETKETLREFKEKGSDESRIEYWHSRKVYESTVENKRCIWQEKAAE